MAKQAITGLHHVTAISGPPQDNVDFYTGTLQQRLVKKTVNFDAPDTYHLYYGDKTGSPGTIMTFFPFVNAGPGRAGPGMAAAHAYQVPADRFDGVMERLAGDAVDFAGPMERFGQRAIMVADPDGAPVELIEVKEPGPSDIGAFHSVTLWEDDIAPTAKFLTDVFGYDEVGHETTGGHERLRLQVPGDGPGTIVDIMRTDAPSIGRQGAGTIHHVAFRAKTHEEHLEWRERVLGAGFGVTPVIDRQYFNAIYFREPGGVLFEIATDPPGFAADEPVETLGTTLKLPPQHEPLRAQLERTLPEIKVHEAV